MYAAIIKEHGAPPILGDFPDPNTVDGTIAIEVETAGLGGWDVLGAYRLGVQYPCVIRGEGVGRTANGKRVYFGEHSTPPFGAWAERTIVTAAEVWEVPDDVDDKTAIAMAIAGTGAYVPLMAAKILPGDTVLVIGATGTVGQLALQYARIMGAGRVVAASRNLRALNMLLEHRLADAVVCVEGSDDIAAFKEQSGKGYDVILDLVCGEPIRSAIKATSIGARVVIAGVGAGAEISFHARDLVFRTVGVVGSGQREPSDREAIWRKLLKLAYEQSLFVEYIEMPFERAAEAWELQKSGPHAKIISKLKT